MNIINLLASGILSSLFLPLDEKIEVVQRNVFSP